MTKEELIYQARERASLEVAFDGSFQIADLLVALADALEAATNPVTFGTEYGVLFRDSEGYDEPVWLAEDEYEARAEAMGHDGKMMKRTVGPWEVCE
jgi:hypothetical protein